MFSEYFAQHKENFIRNKASNHNNCDLNELFIYYKQNLVII